MKKISEWLMELPEPYRTQALHNFKEQQLADSKWETITWALLAAFNWSKTDEDSEGLEYWNDFYENL